MSEPVYRAWLDLAVAFGSLINKEIGVSIKGILFICAAAAVSACADSTEPTNEGALSFAFTGSGNTNGSFAASGIFPTAESQLGDHDAAAGAKDTPNAVYFVAGVKAQTGATYDFVTLRIGRLTPGTIDINFASCNPAQNHSCSAFAYFTGISRTSQGFTRTCTLATGTIVLTSVTDTRLKGSFSGSGGCTDSNLESPTTFVVTSGSFDVVLLSSLPGVS